MQNLINGCDLKKGVDYYLTGAFWYFRGAKVRLKRHEKASVYYNGEKGNAAWVADDKGNEFLIHPREKLFTEPMGQNDPCGEIP